MQPFAGPTSMEKLGPAAPVSEGAAAQSEEEPPESVIQPGKALKPGELLLQPPPEPVEESAMPKADHTDSTSHLGALLEKHHQAVMESFADQYYLLLQISHEVSNYRSPTTSGRSVRFNGQDCDPKSFHKSKSTDTAKESKLSKESRLSVPAESGALSPVSVNSKAERPSQASSSPKGLAPPKPRRPSLTPQLFSTFTHFDLGLQIEAARADGELSRRRYGHSKNATKSRGEVEEPCFYRCLTYLVDHVAFEALFAVVVIMNSMFIGIEVQLQLAEVQLDSAIVSGVQYSFTALFTIEFLLRWLAFGFRRLFCEEDWAWSVLDVIIVISSLWETTVEILAASSDSSNFTALKAFRIIRLSKILRTLRLVRIFRFVNALRMLITSIFHTMKSLFWALVLIFLNVYVFAILFVQAVVDFKEEPAFLEMDAREADGINRYFSSVFMTMLSLFMSIAGGVSWEDLVIPLMAISWVWVACFIFYVSFTYFAVLNVVTAVFCQSAIESAQNDHVNIVQSILANKEAHKQKVGQLFNQLGAADEHSGITFAMFEEKINSPEVREYFSAMGLDIWDAWTFFKLLDVDGGGEIEVEEFLMGCLRLRGQASAMDIQRIIHEQTWLIRSQGKFHTYMENEIRELKDGMAALALKRAPSPNGRA